VDYLFLIELLCSAAVIVFLIIKLSYAFEHFKMKKLISGPSMLQDLPSVSVCIPARNETHAMTQCLERVIASTYPKLEVIVLDDSSVDNTSFLIKSFAHEGVRFVEGSPLPSNWLGKNHALEGLLDEASGTYILYMDVDTLLAPDTIEQLVAYAQQESALMVSVLPLRQDTARSSVLFSTLRYFWELIGHSKKTPAVASNAWMIHRHTLRDTLGSFAVISTDIQPEATLASRLMETNQYRFIISTHIVGVSYEKKWRSQVDTSTRLLFPMLYRNIFFVIAACLILLVTILPLALVFISINDRSYFGLLSSIFELLAYISIYGIYLRKIWKSGAFLGMFLWPVIALQEIVLIISSTIKYKTHTVTWKGRSVVANTVKVQE
jgi:glycosyltransferase involved in cell wall biosynthesis